MPITSKTNAKTQEPTRPVIMLEGLVEHLRRAIVDLASTEKQSMTEPVAADIIRAHAARVQAWATVLAIPDSYLASLQVVDLPGDE